MPLDRDKGLIARIREILTREDTVLFVGSGLSRWSGLPSWKGLIEELASFVESQGLPADAIRKELAANDLLQAASYGVDLLTKPQFAELMRRVCRLGSSGPHDIHKRIITLGPTCFVTTNYDHLLEDSLEKWRPGQLFRVVSNRQLTETADIIQARATNFVFKPHGDVADVDSVILTREQYRVLHGDKIHVLHAMETLIVSRPIVFVGFCLRDLDFMYVKDLLANTYKGGTVDHYAIMADITDQEKDYWRRNYGIHILSYDTPKPIGSASPDHAAILNLLDQLVSDSSAKVEEPTRHSVVSPVAAGLDSHEILALARYSARLVSVRLDEGMLELPLQVSLQEKDISSGLHTDVLALDGLPVERFLMATPFSSLLIGNPGAGKTHAFKRAYKSMAQDVHEACLAESDGATELTIPIYLDLKLYEGSIWQMAERMLPPDLDLELLFHKAKVRFLLDSFNEIPKEYVSSGAVEEDLASFLQRTHGSVVIIGSRTDDGLRKIRFPLFRLDEIDSDFVAEYLSERGTRVDDILGREILRLLRKPLFFRLYAEGRVNLKEEVHPRRIYRSLFETLGEDFQEKFSLSLPLEKILAPIAYMAIDEGKEALLLSQLQTHLHREFLRTDVTTLNGTEFVNWLIVRNVLVPASGSRLTFFHQSVTEYLAAQELARLYTTSPGTLDKLISYTRWDNALYLTLGFLNEKESASFIKQILETDIELAIRSAKFIEHNQEAVVSRILDILAGGTIDYVEDFPFVRALLELPAFSAHENSLRQLMSYGGNLGGVAAILIIRLRGEAVKKEFIEKIFENPNDYNFCQDIGQAISPLITIEDVEAMLAGLRDMEFKGAEEDLAGLRAGIANALGWLDDEAIIAAFSPWQHLNQLQLETYSELLWNRRTPQALAIKIQLVRDGVKSAIFPLHLQVSHIRKGEHVDWTLFDRDLLMALFNALSDESSGVWSLELIRQVCAARPDLWESIESGALNASPIKHMCLSFCNPNNMDAFWGEMSEFSIDTEQISENEPLFLFTGIRDLEWKGKESILVALLKKRNVELARNLLEGLLGVQKSVFQVPIGPICWWLEWMAEVDTSNAHHAFWFCNRLGYFLARYTTLDARLSFLEEFNKRNSPYRNVLWNHILPRMEELNTDMLSEDALSFAIAEPSVIDSLLGSIATPSFVEQRLLPLLPTVGEPLKSNLREALRIAGKRHHRRYVPDC